MYIIQLYTCNAAVKFEWWKRQNPTTFEYLKTLGNNAKFNDIDLWSHTAPI